MRLSVKKRMIFGFLALLTSSLYSAAPQRLALTDGKAHQASVYNGRHPIRLSSSDNHLVGPVLAGVFGALAEWWRGPKVNNQDEQEALTPKPGVWGLPGSVCLKVLKFEGFDYLLKNRSNLSEIFRKQFNYAYLQSYSGTENYDILGSIEQFLVQNRTKENVTFDNLYINFLSKKQCPLACTDGECDTSWFAQWVAKATLSKIGAPDETLLNAWSYKLILFMDQNHSHFFNHPIKFSILKNDFAFDILMQMFGFSQNINYKDIKEITPLFEAHLPVAKRLWEVCKPTNGDDKEDLIKKLIYYNNEKGIKRNLIPVLSVIDKESLEEYKKFDTELAEIAGYSEELSRPSFSAKDQQIVKIFQQLNDLSDANPLNIAWDKFRKAFEDKFSQEGQLAEATREYGIKPSIHELPHEQPGVDQVDQRYVNLVAPEPAQAQTQELSTFMKPVEITVDNIPSW